MLTRFLAFIFLSAVLVATVSGCVGGGGSTKNLEHYQISYLPPKPLPKGSNETLTVERFSSSAIFRRGGMLFRPDTFRIDEYSYNRWRIPPADMLADLVRRDVASAGIFKAVFTPAELQRSRYLLVGRLEDCSETEVNGDRHAVLSLRITMFDNLQKGAEKQILFQKQYKTSSPMKERSPAGLAAAMSMAMDQLSGQIITDISSSVNRGEENPK